MPNKKVTLYAQPQDEFPYLRKKDLKEKEYEETDSLFGAIPFTDVGEEAWRAMKSTDKEASIKLVEAGFGGLPWTVLFYSDNLRAVVSCQKYTKGQPPDNLYIKVRLEGEERVLQRFVRRLMVRLEEKPWKMTDWDDFEDDTGKDMKAVIRSWKKYSEKEQLVKKEKLPETVDTDATVEYKQDVIVLKVTVRNQTSDTIKDLRVTLELDGEKMEPESKEQGVPRVNSTGSYTAMFRLRPKGTLKDEAIKPIVRYNDGKKKKRNLKPVTVTVAPPEISGEAVKRADLDAMLTRFSKTEERGQFQRKPASDLFDDIIGALGKTALFMLDPDVERRGGSYTGTVDLYGKDGDGAEYILRVKVQGDMRESRATRTLYSSDPEKVVGFKQFVEGTEAFGSMFEQKKD